MIGDSPVIRALRSELNRYFSQNKFDGKILVEDGPEYVPPEVSIYYKGRVRSIDVESIQTEWQFSEELASIIEWLKPIKPNPGAASHWKNQPPVDRIGRRPTWLSSSIPHGASGYGSAS